ncbi:MAG: fibronectin type III domain-containing protein, partial [Betaproteobacteria bacterium]
MTLRRRRIALTGVLAMALVGIAAVSHADGPQPGLDGRATIGAYMNGTLPTLPSQPMPVTLSQTNVFTDTPNRIIHAGFVPYALNSPLWTDGAEKSRFIAVPFSAADPENPTLSPKVGFAPDGSWTFPNGTVIVKNFDMQLNEQTNLPATVRRLETRILIRNADGSIRGATYRWREPVAGVYTDADIVPTRDEPVLNITQANGTNRQQIYTFPSPQDCVTCHNVNAGMVLGIRTAQLNGNFTYTSTTRTDNQLHTWDHIGLLNTPINDPTTYPRAVDVADTTATLENRVRSYLASNCSHCHQPGGIGPLYDMRFETPTLASNLIGPYGGLVRDDLANSRLYVRDSALPNNSPMPPIARNLPDARIVGDANIAGVYSEWVNYDYDVLQATRLSATQVRLYFNRTVEAASALNPANYVIDNGVTVTQVTADPSPLAVILTTSPLTPATTFTVTINGVKEFQAPQNPIWPNTTISFSAPATVPDPPVLTGIDNSRETPAIIYFSAPASNGGAPIGNYRASCTSTSPPATQSNTASNAGSISVFGLTLGVQYTCSVTATNAVGESSPSNTMVITPQPRVPQLVAVYSRKTHGTGGDFFDLPVKTGVAIGGAVSVEPRIGTSHQIVFQFDQS